MKKSWIWGLLLTVLLGAGCYFSPKVLYNMLLGDLYSSDWYRLRGYSTALFKFEESPKMADQQNDLHESIWKRFHVENFSLVLPIRNPLYSVVPIIKHSGGENPPQLGFGFNTQNQKSILSIYFLRKIFFSRKLDDQQIFKLPIFRDKLRQKTASEIWKDVFSKNLQGPTDSIDEMVYNLYLLNYRARFFSSRAKAFSYVRSKNCGVLHLDSKNANYAVKIYFMFDGGRTIYPYLLKERLDNPEAVTIRDQFVASLKIEPSSKSVSAMIYQEFQSLAYQDKVAEEGMIYLFSAWSHMSSNEGFLRQMIQFLERGAGNLSRLGPLYDYAFQRYDTNFSSIKEEIKDADRKIQKKIVAEMQQEIKKERKRVLTDIQIDDLSDKDKIEYFLRRAKDKKKKNRDDQIRMD